MSVVGLDFGNNNCVISGAGRGGVDVILNGNSNRLNPNMVAFSSSRSMGENAAISASSNYKNTIFNMKRLIGLTFDDPDAQREMEFIPYKCVPIKHGSSSYHSIGVEVTLGGETKVIPIEVVAGVMVKHMGSIAVERRVAQQKDVYGVSSSDVSHPLFPQDWVVAVPGYYTDAQKRAFLTGCDVAGIRGILRLIHETTATALAYGIFKDIRKEFTADKPTNVMFIDMGATAIQVAIVSFEPGKLIIKSYQTDAHLGGRNFDLCIAKWFADQFANKHSKKIKSKPMDNPKVKIKLLSVAEKAKKTLSPAGVREARMNVECLMEELDFGCSLKAEVFEDLVKQLLVDVTVPLGKALQEAELTAADLTSVEIVGGGTRVGCVKRALSQFLNLNQSMTNYGLSTTMNADEAIARGAALSSAILSPRFRVAPYEIMEYQPYPILISWEGDAASVAQEDTQSVTPNSVVMFDRGSNFPIVRRVTLRRQSDFLVVASYNFDNHTPSEIASFMINVPKGNDKKIRVNVKQDIHGVINLSSAQMIEEIEVDEDVEMAATKDESKEEATKEDTKEEVAKKKKVKKTSLDFTTNRPMEWSKAEFDAAYEAEVAMANADRIVKETSDKRNELESYIYGMRDRIISESALAPYCTEDERASLIGLLEKTENWLYEEGFDATKSIYQEKLQLLQAIGTPIEVRQSEQTKQPAALKNLQALIESSKNWLNSASSNEKYQHLSEGDLKQCHDACDATSAWMYDVLDKQASMPKTADPFVTLKDIRQKYQELNQVITPIQNKPPPKKEVPTKEVPAKEEEKKKEECPKPDNEEPIQNDTPASMDTSE